jgi:hypothetical protein
MNYLHPSLRSGCWTPDEDQRLEEKFSEYGTKWNKISKFFIHRAPLSLRNRHMALIRRHRRVTMSEHAQSVVTSFARMEHPSTRRISAPFSDEELKMLVDDFYV